MAEKRLLSRFHEVWKAELVRNLLQNEGIESVLLKSPREYSSIITGIGTGDEELYVSEENLPRARQILDKYERSTRLTVVDHETDVSGAKVASRRYFVWAGILFAFLIICAGLYYAFVAVK